jgi:hypothetical protein
MGKAILIVVAVLAFMVMVRGMVDPLRDEPPSVPWRDYAPAVKSRIDTLRENKDCRSLQAELNAADANNEATRSRTGHNNASLMGYIDWSLRNAGCYK